MSTLIIYKTQWGATRQYAEWIAEATGDCTLVDIDNFDPETVENYDKIVVGSRTYMGQIGATGFLKQNWDILSTKPVYLFTVGMVPWEKPDAQKAYELIPEHIRQALAGHVKFPGKIEVAKLNLFQKVILRGITGKLEDEDKMDKSVIGPVVDFINSRN